MTPGFDADDSSGTATAWARPLRAEPGQRFSYDNSVPGMVSAILERVTGQTMAALAREQLVAPLAMREPTYVRSLVHLRTVDMAKLGYLLLQDGRWADRPLLPAGFAAEIVNAQSEIFFASGYAGQAIWVHAPLGLVVALTSVVSPQSQQRGQAMRLTRGRILQAVQKRLSSNEK